MNYVIGILSERIKKHQDEIWHLKNIEDIEMQAEQIFIDNDIENHELNIKQLQEAINKLL